MTIQNLNAQVREKDERLREKDERLRRREEDFRVEVQRKQSQIHQQETQLQRKQSQLRQKDEEIHRKDADISRLQRELQVSMCFLKYLQNSTTSTLEVQLQTYVCCFITACALLFSPVANSSLFKYTVRSEVLL